QYNHLFREIFGMNWPDWKKSYYQIMHKLDFDTEADFQSVQLLETYLTKLYPAKKESILLKLKIIQKKPVIIAGAGPSLKKDFSTLFLDPSSSKIRFNFQIIAVDGATTLFKEKNIIPSIVVTDLDGDLAAISWAIQKGALTLIHAHGDNQKQISLFFQKYDNIISKNDVWGTAQCEPGQFLLNFGGFTDGDRAIFLAFHFQSPLIGLIGFDFGTQIGEYSTLNSPFKKKKGKKLEKFHIALDLLASFHSQHSGLRYNLTHKGQQIPGFPRVDVATFLRDWIG
ncbi:MAG: 6-hydroxymethylpterin diphosphokinase MptE-like protein, partial [Candidatus Hodarchaeota archaeon]